MRNENSKTNKGGYTITKKRVYSCICSNCNKNFDGPANGTKFCSDECKLESRIKEHPNKGLCLQCNAKIDKKKLLLNGSKFCSNSCSSKYYNAHRTQEEKERIANICRDSQTKIMNSLSEEDMKKRTTKASKTKSEWSEERKQEHSKLLSENAKRQFEKETPEEKQLRYSKVSNTLNSKSEEEKEKISQKIKDSYYSKTEEEKNIIKEKIKSTRENYTEEQKESFSKKCSENTKELWKNRTEEQKREISEKISQSRYNLFLDRIPNSENFNVDYIKENFIEKGFFKIREFAEYFDITYEWAMQTKNKLGITEPNKRLKIKTQAKLFTDIPTENKILNYRKLIFPQEVDIYLPDIKLAIEYNGLMFHSQGKSKYSIFKGVSKNYHLDKTNLVESEGAQLFHIFEGENLDIWTSIIKNKLGLNTKIYARKCLVKEVSSQEARKFLEDNHLQGYANSKIRLGLYYNEELVSLMTFSKPRYTKNYDWELVRFCTLKGYNVVGGASKLLSSFRSSYKGSIISYANRRCSNGDLYRRLGFKEINRTSPGYYYFKENEMILYTRDRFQKHKLKDLLETFDERLTEEENMFENDYRKIWDCGNLVFVLED